MAAVPWAPLRRGFTLIELIVVIAIIGILGTFVVVNVPRYFEKAQRVKVEHDLRMIVRSAKTIGIMTGRVPESLDELVDPRDEEGQPAPGGLEELPLDPWKRPYGYEVRDGGPRAWCLGRDDAEGGEGDDADWVFP